MIVAALAAVDCPVKRTDTGMTLAEGRFAFPSYGGNTAPATNATRRTSLEMIRVDEPPEVFPNQ